jgi:hypothetical protein
MERERGTGVLRSINGAGGELQTLDSIREEASQPLLELWVTSWLNETRLDSDAGRGGLTRETRPATAVSISGDSGAQRSTHSKSISTTDALSLSPDAGALKACACNPGTSTTDQSTQNLYSASWCTWGLHKVYHPTQPPLLLLL